MRRQPESETAEPARKRTRATYIAALIVVTGAIVLLALWGSRRASDMMPSEQTVSLEKLCSLTGITFPESARLRESSYLTWVRGESLFAAVTMDPQDVAPFMESHCAAAKTSFEPWTFGDIYTRSPVDHPLSWWPPDGQQAMLAESYTPVTDWYGEHLSVAVPLPKSPTPAVDTTDTTPDAGSPAYTGEVYVAWSWAM
jgi:hypothetical protein